MNQEWVANLAAMGFEADVCEHAIEETGSAGMISLYISKFRWTIVKKYLIYFSSLFIRN